MVAAVTAIRGAGWWWWKQECMHGNIWSRVARFGRHVQGGHKIVLPPMAINALVVYLARALVSMCSKDLCSILINVIFFCNIYYY
jgi:hypothetical protein